MRALLRDGGGAATIYASFAMVLMLGVGALALDIGRMSLLKTEMQNRADAAAMGGALYLDGSTDARVRAQQVAVNAATDSSNVPGDESDLAVKEVKFYSQYFPTKVEATSDLDAVYIEVTLVPRRVDFLLAPILNISTKGSGPGDSHDVEAVAVAGPDPFVCNAPPLMMCNLAEEDPTYDFFDPLYFEQHIGKQVVLKEPQGGNATMAPGNFGLLALPDGSKGAKDIEDALAEVYPQQCYSLDVTTATGSKTNKIKDGINARFDLPGNPHPYPAPNVINYDRDSDVAADPQNTKLGNGNWPLDGVSGYWQTKHGTALPSALTDASRYQVYLYELGEEFARDGKKTMYPVPDDFDPLLPAYEDYTLVTPPSPDVPVSAAQPHDPAYDGEPSETVAANGYARRLVTVAVLNCVADNVKGTGTYPTEGRFVRMFLTEYVPDPPNAAIFGEFVKPLTSIGSPDFHANVRLVK